MPAVMDIGADGVKLTWDDLVQLPEDGKRRELIDGELIVTPSPVKRHQAIVMTISAKIFAYLEVHQLGTVYGAPVDTILSKHDVLEPDVTYVSRARERQLEESPWIKGAPTLVVEVESPSTRKRDRTVKREMYERFGVDEYWLVDPDERTVVVFRRAGDRYADPLVLRAAAGDELTTPLLPGFGLPLSAVFRD